MKKKRVAVSPPTELSCQPILPSCEVINDPPIRFGQPSVGVMVRIRNFVQKWVVWFNRRRGRNQIRLVAESSPSLVPLLAEHSPPGRFLDAPECSESCLPIMGRQSLSSFEIVRDWIMDLAPLSDFQQKRIAEMVKAGKLTEKSDVLLRLTLRLAEFSHSDDIVDFATAVLEGKWGNHPNVLYQIATQVHLFSDIQAQRILAAAIFSRRLAWKWYHYREVASHLSVFTDIDAKKIILDAINQQLWRHDERVLVPMAEKISVFREPQCQVILATSILTGKWGNDVTVLAALANQLVVFTDGTAQQLVAESLMPKVWGSDPLVWAVLADHVGIFTHPGAVNYVFQSIKEGVWGDTPRVVRTLVDNLGPLIRIGDRDILFSALEARRWGDDAEIGVTLVHQLVAGVSPEFHHRLAGMIGAPNFGGHVNTLMAWYENFTVFADRGSARIAYTALSNWVTRHTMAIANHSLLDPLNRNAVVVIQRLRHHSIWQGEPEFRSTFENDQLGKYIFSGTEWMQGIQADVDCMPPVLPILDPIAGSGYWLAHIFDGVIILVSLGDTEACAKRRHGIFCSSFASEHPLPRGMMGPDWVFRDQFRIIDAFQLENQRITGNGDDRYSFSTWMAGPRKARLPVYFQVVG